MKRIAERLRFPVFPFFVIIYIYIYIFFILFSRIVVDALSRAFCIRKNRDIYLYLYFLISWKQLNAFRH